MSRDRIVRRVRWKVVRAATGGWLPIVTLGEEPIRLAILADRAAARKAAKAKAGQLREAGQ